MFDKKNLNLQLLESPMRMQSLVLHELADRSNGKLVMSDPNNSFMFMLEANSSIVAQYVAATEKELENNYLSRVSTMEGLYQHMSDFDYLDLTADPASTNISLIFDKNELFEKSVIFNNNYNKLIIPLETSVTLGNNVFGIYYPIEIRINSRTKSFLVSYDASIKNPLHSLATNKIETLEYTDKGLNLIKITLPIFQFNREITEDVIVEEHGFNENFKYSDKFMAARLFTEINKVWTELHYTLSENIYDVSTPTAQLKLKSDENLININIPRIYMNNKSIGSKIRIEIYTTKGVIHLPITANDATTIKIDYKSRGLVRTLNNYTVPLTTLKTIMYLPTEKVIIGGKNNISFSELKNRLIYNTAGAGVPVTPGDLDKYIKDHGFTYTKYKDNVTGRIVFANRKLLNKKNIPIPVTMADIKIDTTIENTTSSIISYDDNSVTIMPTTIYKYVELNELAIPLDDAETLALSKLSSEKLASTLNNTIYTRNPFHIVLYKDRKYPEARTYNLNQPTVSNVNFVKENVGSIAQLTILISDIKHMANGTGGYRIRLGIQKSKELAALDEKDIAIILTTKNSAGKTVHARAVRAGNTDVVDIYNIDIDCTYQLGRKGTIRVNMLNDISDKVNGDLHLVSKFDINLMIRKNIIDGIKVDYVNSETPIVYNSDFVGLVHQCMDVSFGEDLSKEIFNLSDVMWDQKKYATYGKTVYHKYSEDVYEVDSDGSLVTKIVKKKVVLNKLHSGGDTVFDNNKKPLIKHKKGSIKRDASGNAIVLNTRNILYYVQSMMFDARLYASDSSEDINYINQLPNEISGYLTLIKKMRGQLLDQTELYFKPVRTLGSTKFELGGGVTRSFNLGIGFNILYYVNDSVIASQSQKDVIEVITNTVIDKYIAKRIISISEITTALRDTLGDTIDSLDSVGFNNSSLQTFIVKENDVSPMVNLKLILQENGDLKLKRDVKISFALTEISI